VRFIAQLVEEKTIQLLERLYVFRFRQGYLAL
jgi:hypothetical protein